MRMVPLLALLACVSLVACGDDSVTTPPACGDGTIQSDEACDDGNEISSDGCSLICFEEAGFQCVGEPSICSTVCGDGVQAGTEQCDDSNVADGDGCSATCQSEQGEVCDDLADNDGDGLTDCADPDCIDGTECLGAEVCNNGTDDDGDRAVDCADSDCSSLPLCTGIEDCSNGVDDNGDGLADCLDDDCDCECGDGTIQAPEVCDDGPNNSDVLPDACRLNCLEADCGDGVVDTGEVCDSGPANGPTGPCSLDCLTGVSVSCGTERSIVDLNVAATPQGTGFTWTGQVGAAASDDFLPPIACTGADGPDTAFRFVAPAAGQWAFRLSTSPATSGMSVSVSTTCGGVPTSCSDGTAANLSAIATSLLEEGDEVFIMVDSGLLSTVQMTLEALAISALLPLDAECEPDSITNICSPDLRCGCEGDAACSCTATPIGGAGIGEACSAEVRCAAGLECTSRVCAPIGGTTCDTAFDGSVQLSELPRTETIDVSPSVRAEAGSCAGFARIAIIDVDPAVSGIATVTARSASGGDVRLMAREVCALAVSELDCDLGLAGDTVTLQFEVEAAVPVTLFVGGSTQVIVETVVEPFRNLGQSCGPEDGRCGTGLACSSGRVCIEAPAGSCARPIDVLDEGVGELTGRGLVLSVDASVAINSEAASCVGDGNDLVFSIATPNAGQLTGTFIPDRGSPSAGLSARDFCESPEAEIACEASSEPTLKLDLRRGQRIFLIVDGEDSGESPQGTLSVALEPRAEIGQPCSVADDCLAGAVCEGAVCAWVPVGAGETCTLGGAPCEDGFLCYGPRANRLCVNAVAALGEACDVAAVGPQCETGLVCGSDTGEAVCARLLVGIGGACTEDGECSEGLRCSEDAGLCAIVEFRAGDRCEPVGEAPCGRDLECVEVAGQFECTEAAPSDGEPCSEATPCQRGLDCTPQPSGSSLCRRQLRPGDTCNPAPGQAPCPFGFTCSDIGAGLQCNPE